MRANLRSAGAAILVAIPTVLAFFSGGFFDRPRLIGALAAWVLVVVGALTVGRPLPATTLARLALLGLLALCAWTALSLLWTPTPARAEDDFQRLLLYAGVFIAAFALLRGDRAHAWLEPALLLGIVIVIGYGLSERLFPELLEFRRSRASAGRLEQPLTYWNAVGALGAMGVVLAIRLAAADRRAGALRAAAAAAGVVLGLGVYLSFSRGALAAVGAGVLVLLALAPSGRAVLRSAALVLVLGTVSAVVASMLPTVESLAVGADGNSGQGVIMLVSLVALGAAAAGLQLALRSRESSGAQRLRLPVSRAALVVGVTAVTIGGAALATVLGESPRGESPPGGASPQRLGSVDTNRYRYWEVALETFGDHPIAGIGAGGFFVEWRALPFPQRTDHAADAHSLPLETAAELGVVGLAALLLLLGGVVGGARRLFARSAEVAVGPIAACTAWGVHSAIDWDWEMPAVTLPALILAAALLAWSESSTETARTRPAATAGARDQAFGARERVSRIPA